MLFNLLFSIISLATAVIAADGYSWHETVEGLQVFSVSYDSYGSQHIVLKNTSNENLASDLFIFEKNTEYQNFQNPDNYTIIPYFSYGVNVTALYVNTSVTPDISSFGHYIDYSNNTGHVVELEGKKTTINLTSTEQVLVVKEPLPLGAILGNQLAAAANKKLANNVVFIQFGDLHLRYAFSKSGLKKFSDDQKKILRNIMTDFILIHEQFGSVPGVILNNFDGNNNHAYITFGHSEAVFANTIVVDEETFASVALQ